MVQVLLQGVPCRQAFQSVAGSRPSRTSHVCKAASQHVRHTTRRQLLETSSQLAAALTLVQPDPAYAGLERYVKKKKLDPLETYVPLVLEARDRLADLGSVMETAPSEARQPMRSGSFSGLRDNIRALGQYASALTDQGGLGLSEKDASALVSNFFHALEDFDLVLYNAVREAKAAEKKAGNDADKLAQLDPAAALDKKVAAEKLQAAVQELDKLVATVPEGILKRSKEVLQKVSSKAAAAGLS